MPPAAQVAVLAGAIVGSRGCVWVWGGGEVMSRNRCPIFALNLLPRNLRCLKESLGYRRFRMTTASMTWCGSPEDSAAPGWRAQVGAVAGSLKEAKKQRGYEAYRLLAAGITFRTHIAFLLSLVRTPAHAPPRREHNDRANVVTVKAPTAERTEQLHCRMHSNFSPPWPFLAFPSRSYSIVRRSARPQLRTRTSTIILALVFAAAPPLHPTLLQV